MLRCMGLNKIIKLGLLRILIHIYIYIYFFFFHILGELSSISGSDSDTDNDDGDLMLESSQCSKPSINSLLPEQNINSETHTSLRRQHPKVFFVNGDGEVMSVYRSVLYSVQVKFYCIKCGILSLSLW